MRVLEIERGLTFACPKKLATGPLVLYPEEDWKRLQCGTSAD